MGQVHGDCTVDSAVFHKERLFRCVDDITFLPAGPRYIVNIRAGGAHFSDEILRKNRHFDVIHVSNFTYWQQQYVAQYVIGRYIAYVYFTLQKFKLLKETLFHTLFPEHFRIDTLYCTFGLNC